MSAKILEGVKVADFSWIGVGPVTTRGLADHGATVVHIESETRPDALRFGPPFKDRETGINNSAFFANFNASKLGVSLNIATPQGVEVAKRLIAWADIVAESFTPGTMASRGLDYESVRQWKPDVIYYSTCQLGQTGRWASQPGFGTQLAAWSGFYHLSAWPDRGPTGPYGAYTDFVTPPIGMLGILAALDHRRRTGVGQHVDLSQLEAAIHFLGPLVMDSVNTGRVAGAEGNRDPNAAPHGVYPCIQQPDVERWIAIAVSTDEQWEALLWVMGDPDWAGPPDFATFLARKVNEDELDRHMAEWTQGFHAHELMARLQDAGVPAGVVQASSDLHSDPQLRHRDAFPRAVHGVIGEHAYDGVPFVLSETPSAVSAGPCMGQHNEMVYREFLGMSEEEYQSLLEAGVFA